MSDVSAAMDPVSVETAPVVDTPDLGAPDASAEVAATQEPEAPLYDVNVGGEVTKVTLEELQKGYSRQQDYTRKTQELASQRKELEHIAFLANQLDQDPEGTLEALSRAYNWSPTAAQAQAEPNWEEMDPLEQRIVRAEQFMEEQARQTRRAEIDREIETLKTKYGADVDVDAVIRHTVQNRLPNLEVAYKDLHFAKQQETAAIVEQKRAAQIVEGGSTTQKGSVSAPPPRPASIREALRLAYREQVGS